MGELPLPRLSPPASNKRDRDSDKPAGASAPSDASAPDEARHIAGSRRANAAARPPEQPQHQHPAQPPPHPQAYPAPPAGPSQDAPAVGGAFAPLPVASVFPGGLGGWFGYDSAGSQQGPAAASGSMYGAAPAPPAAPAAQAFPTLDVGQMFSAQSMMYDQVLSNLSASLSETTPAGATAPAAPYDAQPADARSVPVTPDNFTDLLASFGEDYGAIFPDFNNDGSVNFQTWTGVPQGYE